MRKLNAKELRGIKGTKPSLNFRRARKNSIYIVLDNVLDTYNVGSIFRLADAVAAEKVILCGETQVPPNSRIKKASINTTEVVEWEYSPTAIEAISKIKNQISNIKIIGIEQSPKSVPYTKIKITFPVVLVAGNETHGVSKEVLEMCDEIAEIPMWGINKSLNVMVSLGIILYKLTETLSQESNTSPGK